MPVTKFRSAEEMNATPVAGDPADDFGRFLRHCARFRLTAPRSYPRGVFKFRDLAVSLRLRTNTRTAARSASRKLSNLGIHDRKYHHHAGCRPQRFTQKRPWSRADGWRWTGSRERTAPR
jgi:hypothetical protein